MLVHWSILVAAACFHSTVADFVVTDHSHKILLVFDDMHKSCNIVTNKREIKHILLTSGQPVEEVSYDDLLALRKTCSELSSTANQPSFSFPGTKWCGPGTSAKDFDDLGMLTELDKCCREHDFCPVSLKSGECNYGLCNDSPFTRSLCDCDKEFRQCLIRTGTREANVVGTIFFNFAPQLCLQPPENCRDEDVIQCPWEYQSTGEYHSGNEL